MKTHLNVTLLLDFEVHIPETGNEIIATNHSNRTLYVRTMCQETPEANADSLLDHLADKLFILADFGVQLVVSRLDSFGLLKTDSRKWTWEESNRRTCSQDAASVDLRSYDRHRWPHSESVANCPVLNHLNEPLALLPLQYWRVRTGRESRHLFP